MLVDLSFLRAMRPVRDPNVHKGRLGHALLFCGSVGYAGAARLAAGACARSGAGLITLCVPQSIYTVIAPALPPEIMCRPLPNDEAGRFSPLAVEAAEELLTRCDAVLVGPGLGRSEGVDAFVRALVQRCTQPVVVDADGITALAAHILVQPTCPLIFTPHDGEFARLGGDTENPDRAAATCALAQQRNAVVVRKGPGTVTAWPSQLAPRCTPEERFHQNTSGGPALAKGGSGDVLAGLLIGLLAQFTSSPAFWCEVNLPDIIAAGVFLHGLAGDLGAQRMGERGFTPSDLIDHLPEALRLCFEDAPEPQTLTPTLDSFI